MKAKDKKKIIRLLCMQIDAHVEGDTRLSDKVLAFTEVTYMIFEIQNSVNNYIALTNSLIKSIK